MSRFFYFGLEVGRKAAGRPHKRREGCMPITKAKLVTGATVRLKREKRLAEYRAFLNAGFQRIGGRNFDPTYL